MGAWQDIFSLITDITNSLKYFLSADRAPCIWSNCWCEVSWGGEGDNSQTVSYHEGPRLLWRKVAVRLVRLANNLGFNSGPPGEPGSSGGRCETITHYLTIKITWRTWRTSHTERLTTGKLYFRTSCSSKVDEREGLEGIFNLILGNVQL